MLDSFYIGRYRGLKDITFNDLKNINVFVGQNNSGKTSVLEALILSGLFDDVDLLVDTLASRYQIFSVDLFKSMFTLGEKAIICLESRLQNSGNKIHTHVQYESAKRIKNSKESTEVFEDFTLKFSYNACEDKEIKDKEDLNESFFIKFEEGEDGYSVILGKPKECKIDYKIPCQFVSFSRFDRSKRLLQTVDEVLDSNRRTELIDVLRIFDKDVENFEVIGKNRVIKIFKKGYNEPLSLNDYGNGMYKAFFIATSALLCKNGIFLIDEIEAGIHSEALSQFITRLLQVCKDNNVQLFLTTHSLEAIDVILNNCQDSLTDTAIYHLMSNKSDTKLKRYSGEKLIQLRNEFGFDVR